MKKQVFRGIISILLTAFLVAAVWTPAFAESEGPGSEDGFDSGFSSSVGDGEPGEAANTADGSYVEGELVGLFESEEEAIACAELYGIELLSFNNRVAVFGVEGDLKKLIEKGKENGWPELSLNYVYSFFQ